MVKKTRYCFFVGTQAELIKLLPVIREFEKRNIPFTFISSGQNELSKELLGNAHVDIQLHEKILFPHMIWVIVWFFQTMLRGFFIINKRIKRSERGIMLIHGDTISSLMGALLGRALGFKIAHIEAGLRSFKLTSPFPEEIDRLIISKLTTYHFCPNKWSCDNLKQTRGIKIDTEQNTLWEQYQKASMKKIALDTTLHKPYFLFVIHRQENLYNRELVTSLVSEIVKQSDQLNAVFILHEPTKIALIQYNLLDTLKKNKNVILLPRQDYYLFSKIIENSQFMVTDGGSNQEESYYMGKPCLVLRTVTERIEGLGENVVMSNNKLETIHDFFVHYKKYVRKPLVTAAKPSEIIVDYLQNI
ncbi:MAG: UDP-N-acetylglucosamine 2-epimerase [Candidatus Roizmanbacteria bacterium]|nr:UDP-N-acetylglucosamine 2-epimerase [Candidatus Roizmanbacteria bacterium]